MLALSEKFFEQDSRIQKQFDEWTPFEQIYASVELTRKLHASYRHFLVQFLSQTNSQQENNDMFHHTIHQANTPVILACLLSDPVDKIISTLQLYLPLVSMTTSNEKLLESYQTVLKHLDSKLDNPMNFPYSEQQLIAHCQQIKFFIQTNPCLQKFLVDIPQLNALTTSPIIIHKANLEEKPLTSSPSNQRHHQPLQRYPSIRVHQQTTSPQLMNFSSEGSHNSSTCPSLIHHVTSDSGVDLSEPLMINTGSNTLSTHDSQHTIIGRSHSDNLALAHGQDNQNSHMFVGKTTSSPTPEQTLPNHSSLTPLSAVLSAPAQSLHSYYLELHHQNSNYQQQQIKTKLPISDEDEEDLQMSSNFIQNPTQPAMNLADNFYLDVNSTDNRARLGQYRSLRNRDTRPHPNQMRNNNEIVSPYLGVDVNCDTVSNKFLQPNSGMRDVPKWLKTLRLHKYAFFFSQMSYDQMMNLTHEQLKEGKITDGACTKILLNIRKLKERQTSLHKCLIDLDNGQTDIKSALQLLNELMLTPIRVKQTDNQNDNDTEHEDLPALIMQVLEKVYQQLTSNNSSTNMVPDLCNNLVGLFDRCYKHEAFSPDQRLTLLRWRGPLCHRLQTSGKIDFKSMQSSSSLNRRVQLKPQSSMGNMNTTQLTKPTIRSIKSTSIYHSNYHTNSVPLSRQYNPEVTSQNGNNNNNSTETNATRRPTKSPTLIFQMNDDYYGDSTALTNHISITSTPSLQEQLINHKAIPFITERTGNGTGNFRPSVNYTKSQATTNSSTYLATNQHQLLTRKKSIGPFGDTNAEDDKTKLCKTFSDPSKIGYFNALQTVNTQSTTYSQISPSKVTYGATLTPYSTSQYSQPNSQSSIQNSYSNSNSSTFYGNDTNNVAKILSLSNENHNIENTYQQSQDTKAFGAFCEQLAENTMNDNNSATDRQEDSSNIHPQNPSSDE